MKTVFVVNPAAGQGKDNDLFVKSLNNMITRICADASVYVTNAVGDATRYVRAYCESNGPARFVACGGDGTLGEVLNGAIDCEGAEVGVVPMGTGNDFCRNFGDGIDFSNTVLQIDGEAVACDAIKYTTEINGEIREGYCANMFNIGFDCNVADMTSDMKKKPFISGSLAYFVSILVSLIRKKCSELKVVIDGIEKHNGKLLLTSIANGCYCGGGIKSNPTSSVSDGMLDVNIIRDLPRWRFITLLPSYMKGTIHKVKNIDKYISFAKCKKIAVTPNDGKMRLCIDGEIIEAGKTRFEIVHNAFKFVVPCAEKMLAECSAEKMPELV
jgi:YegS/Rv2252/BmrU family lipid kinase